jgi:hypothetical protein
MSRINSNIPHRVYGRETRGHECRFVSRDKSEQRRMICCDCYLRAYCDCESPTNAELPAIITRNQSQFQSLMYLWNRKHGQQLLYRAIQLWYYLNRARSLPRLPQDMIASIAEMIGY